MVWRNVLLAWVLWWSVTDQGTASLWRRGTYKTEAECIKNIRTPAPLRTGSTGNNVIVGHSDVCLLDAQEVK